VIAVVLMHGTGVVSPLSSQPWYRSGAPLFAPSASYVPFAIRHARRFTTFEPSSLGQLAKRPCPLTRMSFPNVAMLLNVCAPFQVMTAP
jgi:hypothetical protein